MSKDLDVNNNDETLKPEKVTKNFRINKSTAQIIEAWAEVTKASQQNQSTIIEKLILDGYDNLDDKLKKRIQLQIELWNLDVD